MAPPGRRKVSSALMMAAMPELKTAAAVAPGSSGAICASRISALGWLMRE